VVFELNFAHDARLFVTREVVTHGPWSSWTWTPKQPTSFHIFIHIIAPSLSRQSLCLGPPISTVIAWPNHIYVQHVQMVSVKYAGKYSGVALSGLLRQITGECYLKAAGMPEHRVKRRGAVCRCW